METLDKLLGRIGLTHKGFKRIGNSDYIHLSNDHYLNNQGELLKTEISNLKMTHCDITFSFAKISQSHLTLISVDDETSFEPVLTHSVTKKFDSSLSSARLTSYKSNPPIYHHVWLMFPPDTDIIDITSHKLRSLWWKSQVGSNRHVSSRIGRLEYWKELLGSLKQLPTPPNQKVTSKNTSINAKKLPALVSKSLPKINPNDIVLDIGAGKFNNTKEAVEAIGAIYTPLDPYNRSDLENEVAWIVQTNGLPNIILCANVLNVIEEDTVVDSIITSIIESVKISKSCTALISIYEGNKSCVGKPTGKDQYQRNEPTIHYVKRIEKLSPSLCVVLKKGVITVSKK